jgi:tRNA threonylcarbamoyladenosine biosynthesis protein TsaE
VTVPTADDMRRLGARLAGDLAAGDLVVVTGPLGAGKTVFIQGVGAGLGVTEPVLSPTFVLARVHRSGRVPLVHVDAYRLTGASDPFAEIDALDLDTDLADAVVAVEWGEGLVERLTGDRLEVRIDPPTDGADERAVTVRGIGPRWAGREPRP